MIFQLLLVVWVGGGAVVLFRWPSPYKEGRTSQQVFQRKAIYTVAGMVYLVGLCFFIASIRG